MNTSMNQDVGASVQYPNAHDQFSPLYANMPQAQARPGSFAPSAAPQPYASNGAPVFSWSASPRGRTSAELPFANVGGVQATGPGLVEGSLDFTLEPTPAEAPVVYAQPPPPGLQQYASPPTPAPELPSHAWSQALLQQYAQPPTPGLQHYGSVPMPAPEQYGSGFIAAPEQSKPGAMRGLAYGKPLDVMEMFPTFFTAFCFGTFITPIVLSYHVGHDPQVLFWIGDYINWVMILPALYVWAHIYHTIHRVPSKVVVVVCLIGSCIVLLVLGEHVLLDAYDRANEFTARDCETFPRKMQLQRSWEAARTYYANCMVSMSGDLGISYESAVSTYRIADCSDYQMQLDRNSEWRYLASLEEQHQCAGWCEPGQAIWTLGTVRDSCSSTVGDIMNNKIRWTMLQVVVYTMAVLAIVSTMLVATGPNLWMYKENQNQYV